MCVCVFACACVSVREIKCVSIDSYQSECGSISQYSSHSEGTTTAAATAGSTVAEEESFDVYCDSVNEESLSHVSLSVSTSNVLYLMDNLLS